MNLNKLYLVGTLKTDPETRETHSGSTVTRIVLTVHREYFSKERNQRVRESDSFEVQAWGGLGQQIAHQFKKGSQILIEGRLKQDSWETPTGERRQRIVVHAESFAPVGATTAAPVVEGAEAAAAAAGGDDGPTPTVGGGAPGAPGTSGKRKRRRRRGPRRDGLPPGPITPQTPEERAAFAAGLTDAPAGTNPQPPAEAPAPGTAPPRAESAPSAPPPPPPPAPSPPPPPAEKPKPATSLKEDMPF